MKLGRWLVGLGALLIAGLALYVLIVEKPPSAANSSSPRAGSPDSATKPAMDEIDSKSRDAMRELLREAE